jgi:hypothetical protein
MHCKAKNEQQTIQGSNLKESYIYLNQGYEDRNYIGDKKH